MRAVRITLTLALAGAAFGGGYAVRATRHAPAAAAPAARRVLYYVDPMHPAYRSDRPGVAPDCGMKLEPVYADAGPPDLSARSAPSAPVPGAIHIPPDRQQLIGVRFATVERGGATRYIRAAGRIGVDETRVSHVHTRVDGWIDSVFVNFTGDAVRKGEPLLTIYSPEMLASQQELLLAARERDLMRTNPLASAAEQGESLFDAARRRLQLWDLSDSQIDQVLRTGQPIRDFTVYAPAAGYVTERNAFPNQRATPDTNLYTITDLSRVWILANVFEADIASVRIGDRAYVSFTGDSAPPLGARVSWVNPQVDPATRTIEVRLDAPNPGTRMKPDMYVDVEFGVATTPPLTVPADAVLDSGDHQTVFVDRGNGYLEPRQVVAGERFEDRVAITSGLTAGERVVASGTFLVDSESQLKATAEATTGPAAPAKARGHRHD
jgi:Cu(I)/Ag(I) efflux system membrane fusion protein